MVRLLINFWILIGFVGSVLVVTMVFAYIIVLFDEMMRKLRK